MRLVSLQGCHKDSIFEWWVSFKQNERFPIFYVVFSWKVLSDPHKRALFDSTLKARVEPAADAGASGDGGPTRYQNPLPKAPPMECKVPCTLEELYKGIAKEVKISRSIIQAPG